jgi:hypothetical protein
MGRPCTTVVCIATQASPIPYLYRYCINTKYTAQVEPRTSAIDKDFVVIPPPFLDDRGDAALRLICTQQEEMEEKADDFLDDLGTQNQKDKYNIICVVLVINSLILH